MTAEEVRLLGFIGLRALAEYDPPEYRRVSDISKRQLDLRIRDILPEVNSEECTELYNSLNNIVDSLESPLELTYLLRQIYIASTNKAQYYSLQISRQEKASSYEQSIEGEARPAFSNAHQDVINEGDELIRLSTMLMLRELHDYSYDFHRHIGEVTIDCVLEPKLPDLPFIFVEAKPTAHRRQVEEGISEIGRALENFRGNAIGAVVTEASLERRGMAPVHENIYLLRFDVRRNQFVGGDFKRLTDRLANR